VLLTISVAPLQKHDDLGVRSSGVALMQSGGVSRQGGLQMCGFVSVIPAVVVGTRLKLGKKSVDASTSIVAVDSDLVPESFATLAADDEERRTVRRCRLQLSELDEVER